MARKKNYPKKKRGFLIVNGKLRYPDIILVLLVVALISVQLTKWVLDVGNVQNTEPQTEQDAKNNSDKSSFIKVLVPVAQEQQRQHHVFSSITLAQAALESDWGRSELSSKYNNLFGIKSNQANSVLLTTQEYVNGQWITVKARFATYDSWADSVRAHTQLFLNGTQWDKEHYRSVLEDRIRQDGVVLPGNVLKVNQFLNHQIDPQLMYEIGQEFARLFKERPVTKILTVEASGIAPAIMAGLVMNVPVLFARKKKPSTLDDMTYTAEVYSYTKKVTNTISVDSKFLSENDHVLIIDDFLANGQAVKGMLEICRQADVKVEGVGIVVEKSFQEGADWIKGQGIRLESLARISSFENDAVHFVGEE